MPEPVALTVLSAKSKELRAALKRRWTDPVPIKLDRRRWVMRRRDMAPTDH